MPFIVLLVATAARADLVILTARNAGTDEIPAFRFPGLAATLSAVDRGSGSNTTWRVLQGTLNANSGTLSVLNDGSGQTNNDSPKQSLFFADTPSTSPAVTNRLLLDLGAPVLLGQINTYSWHNGNRAPQVYSLYAATGHEPNFDPNPTSAKDGGDPTKLGYTLLGQVDTTATFGLQGGQYAVSFQDNLWGNLGSYRYLLWLVQPPSAAYGYWNNTFYGECDVIAASTPAAPQVRYPARPQLLWGTSDKPDAALLDPLFTNAPVKLIAPWFSVPGDLAWLSPYTNTTFMSDRYAQGNAFEVIVWLAWEPDYAISPQFLTDVQTLARIFKGNGPDYGPSYFVLYTEFETYTNYLNTNYYSALRDTYLQAVDLIHQANTNAYVSLGFGSYDWFGKATKTFDVSFWEPAIRASDFMAVQGMASADFVTNNPAGFAAQMTNAINQLGSYGKPVMLSYFDVWSTHTDPDDVGAFSGFLTNFFTDSILADLCTHGLFAWTLENEHYLTAPGPTFGQAAQMVTRYAWANLDLPRIVDNADAGGASLTGPWVSTTRPAGYYGSNYVVAMPASPGAQVRFSPALPKAGSYGVYLRWTAQSGRASNVPVQVAFSGGRTWFSVDETTNGGQWVWLGNFNFDAGTNGSVTLHTDGANGSVAADAALFAFQGAHSSAPVAPTFSSASWTADRQLVVNFSGSPNAYYRVWGSTNLSSWTPLGNATPQPLGGFQFSDPDAGRYPQRYYRAEAP